MNIYHIGVCAAHYAKDAEHAVHVHTHAQQKAGELDIRYFLMVEWLMCAPSRNDLVGLEAWALTLSAPVDSVVKVAGCLVVSGPERGSYVGVDF